jgi:hypothetical protein
MSWLHPEEDDLLAKLRAEQPVPFRYADNPVGTSTTYAPPAASVSQVPAPTTSAPPASPGWGPAARQAWGDIKTGAGALGGLLTADVQTPIAQGMRFPNLVIPEGATVEEWDDGPKFRLPDGSLKDPKDLPQRGTVLPVSKDPKGWQDTSLAMPGAPSMFPTAFSQGGASVAAEGPGVILGAGAARGTRARRAALAGRGVEEGAAAEEPFKAVSSLYGTGSKADPLTIPPAPTAARAAAPAAPPASLSEGLLTQGDNLFDPVRGASAREGALQGMSPAEYQAWIEGRAGLLDPGVSALNRVSPKGERGMNSLPKIREMDPQTALAEVRANPDAHLIPRSDGSLVGAPHWVRTPEDIAKMRADFDAAVARGAQGSDWYDRVHGYIREVSGGDPVKMRALAEEFAVFSAQADPTTNFGFSQQARNAFVRDPENPATKVRTGQQASTFNEARTAQEEFLRRNATPGSDEALAPGETIPNMREGKKTGIYRQHMDPTAEKGSTGTNDIWHARVFGFIDPKTGKPWDKALGEAQHTFLDRETMLAVDRANAAKVGGRDNWTAAEIQAAPWVAAKSESLQSRFKISPEEGFRRATSTYPNVAPSHTASMPFESVPAQSTGLTTGSLSADEWHGMNRRVTPGGLDPTLDYLGFQQRRVEPATGAWREDGGPIEHNPVDVSRPMIDYKTIDKKKQVNPDTLAALESVAAVRGVSDMQAGTPATMWNTQAPAKARIHPTIDIGRGVTAEEAARLNTIAEEHGMQFANRGEGAGFLNYDNPTYPTYREVKAALKARLGQQIKEVLPDAKINMADLGNSPYVDYGDRLSYADRGQGRATRYMDEILQRNQAQAPGVYRGLLDDPNEAAHAQANLARLQASGQIGKRPDYELWQKLIAEGRLRSALEWARANGYKGLPAVGGGAVVGGGLLGGDGSTPGGA